MTVGSKFSNCEQFEISPPEICNDLGNRNIDETKKKDKYGDAGRKDMFSACVKGHLNNDNFESFCAKNLFKWVLSKVKGHCGTSCPM